MTRKLVVKDHPEIEIVGSLETIFGVASIYVDEDGWSYSGGTKVDWDSQESVKRHGQRVFVDDDGEEYLENQVEILDIIEAE